MVMNDPNLHSEMACVLEMCENLHFQFILFHQKYKTKKKQQQQKAQSLGCGDEMTLNATEIL